MTVSEAAALFVSEMEPPMEPEIVMVTLLSAPNAGLNWVQFITAAAKSVS